MKAKAGTLVGRVLEKKITAPIKLKVRHVESYWVFWGFVFGTVVRLVMRWYCQER